MFTAKWNKLFSSEVIAPMFHKMHGTDTKINRLCKSFEINPDNRYFYKGKLLKT